MVRRIETIINSTDGVKRMHHLRTRRNGRFIIIDCHIKVNPQITVIEGHDIATSVERNLKARFGDNTITNIHVEPFKE
jgi:divalent metal cation (Fe/Co/Zn/Cd) transporter